MMFFVIAFLLQQRPFTEMIVPIFFCSSFFAGQQRNGDWRKLCLRSIRIHEKQITHSKNANGYKTQTKKRTEKEEKKYLSGIVAAWASWTRYDFAQKPFSFINIITIFVETSSHQEQNGCPRCKIEEPNGVCGHSPKGFFSRRQHFAAGKKQRSFSKRRNHLILKSLIQLVETHAFGCSPAQPTRYRYHKRKAQAQPTQLILNEY